MCRGALLSVNLAPVADLDDHDDKAIVQNFIQNAVVAHTKTVDGVGSLQLFYLEKFRIGVVGKQVEGLENLRLNRVRQPLVLLLRALLEKDCVQVTVSNP